MVCWLVGCCLCIYRKLMPYPLHFICMYKYATVDTSRYLYCYPFVLIPIHTYWYDVVWLCCGTTLGILICRDCNKIEIATKPAIYHSLYICTPTHTITIDILFSSFLPFVATSHYCIHAVHFVSKDALNKLSNNTCVFLLCRIIRSDITE